MRKNVHKIGIIDRLRGTSNQWILAIGYESKAIEGSCIGKVIGVCLDGTDRESNAGACW